MITKEQFNQAIKVISAYEKQLEKEILIADREKRKIIRFRKVPKGSTIDDFGFSVRAFNAIADYLKRNKHYDSFVAKDISIKDIQEISLESFIKHKNVGSKTVAELVLFCEVNKIKLK